MTQKIIQKQEYTGSAAQSQISLFIVITVPEKSFEKMPDETNCSFIALVKSSRTSFIIPVTVTTSVKKLRKRELIQIRKIDTRSKVSLVLNTVIELSQLRNLEKNSQEKG